MTWQNRLLKKARLDSPVVEMTPVIWKNKLLLVETWQKHWDRSPESMLQRYVRIRDEQADEIISRFMDGYGLASALVWNDTIYVFASQMAVDNNDLGHMSWNDVYMSHSENLTDWTEPKCVIKEDEGEQLFNQSVCYDGNRFLMAYESNSHVPFTIKFAESDNLQQWQKIPGAIYGTHKYAACPAIRHVGGYYYMLYLEHLKPRWWFETYLTRSKNLIHWQDAPHNPVIAPDPGSPIHPDCPEHPERGCTANSKECNASDPDLVEWQGKTRVYFTGGCQHWGGYLQYAEFNGSMQEFFESYYEYRQK